MRIDFRWAVLLAALGACAHAAARADLPAFRGVYRVGPGISAFRPCGSDQEWYVAPSSASGLELQRRTGMRQDEAPRGGMRTEAPAGADAGSFQRAYVEVQGDTVALTAGPEVRRFTRELRPTRVLLVERAVEAAKRCGDRG